MNKSLLLILNFVCITFLCTMMFSSCNTTWGTTKESGANDLKHEGKLAELNVIYNKCLSNAQSAADSTECQNQYKKDTTAEGQRYRKEKKLIEERDKCEKYQKFVLEKWGYSEDEAKNVASRLRDGSYFIDREGIAKGIVKYANNDIEVIFNKKENYKFNPDHAILELQGQNFFDQKAIEIFETELPKYNISKDFADSVRKMYYNKRFYTKYSVDAKEKIEEPMGYKIGQDVYCSREMLIKMRFIKEDKSQNNNNDPKKSEMSNIAQNNSSTTNSENNENQKLTSSYQDESNVISKLSVSKYGINEIKLTSEQKNELDGVIAFMKKWPETKIIVIGHTCSIGSDVVNNAIGLQRADQAKRYMVAQGIDESRIEEVSKAATEPCASNDTEDGRLQNRRITFIVK